MTQVPEAACGAGGSRAKNYPNPLRAFLGEPRSVIDSLKLFTYFAFHLGISFSVNIPPSRAEALAEISTA